MAIVVAFYGFIFRGSNMGSNKHSYEKFISSRFWFKPIPQPVNIQRILRKWLLYRFITSFIDGHVMAIVVIKWVAFCCGVSTFTTTWLGRYVLGKVNTC